MKILRLGAFFIALLAGLSVAHAKELVKLDYVPSLYAAPLFVAQEKGYFDQAGIKLEMRPITAVTEVVPLLSTGQIDIATGGYGAGIFSAISKGIDIKIVAPMGVVPKDRCSNPLLVRKASGIKSVQELKGKRVACAGQLVGGSGFQLVQILEAHGLSGNDVIINNLRFPDQTVAMTQGAVDAAMSSEPFATMLVKDGVADVIACSTPGTSVTGLLYSGQFMKQRKEIANNFMVALMKGFRDVQGDKFFDEENLKIFTKYTRVAPEVIKEMKNQEWDPNLAIGVETLLQQQEMYMRYGSLKYTEPLKPEQFIDKSYVNHAISVLGRYSE